jgi:hypothetical protein
MKSIKSKIGIRRIAILLYYLLTAGFGIWLCKLAFTGLSVSEFPAYFTLFMGLAFCIIPIYGVIWDSKNAHSVEIDEEKITMSKRRKFYWDDLQSVNLYASKYLGRGDYKAIMIKFKNEEIIYLYNFAYSNINAMRDYLREHVIEKRK